MHPYSLHLKSDEVVNVINECAEALNLAFNRDVELPALDAIHTKLNALLGSREQTRA
jgi:hypothetical protein